ncbi:hypothetical protein L2E82_31380 [Cichorium intybus]|uniref:Uncharacterized protein n=1 Tax=Cichorium intybus TaxID=13427 RepID=A0ACB9D334_CICIN|nr:hypothetical protein L2E82_31380 [Cichorium intybus]
MIMAWLKSFQTARFEGISSLFEDDMKPALCCGLGAGFLVDLLGEFLLDTSALEKADSRHHGKQWERSTGCCLSMCIGSATSTAVLRFSEKGHGAVTFSVQSMEILKKECLIQRLEGDDGGGWGQEGVEMGPLI